MVCGDDLVATQDGLIKRVRPLHPLMGNYIIVEHGGTWCDMYEHMQDFSAETGQPVKAGDLIGHMGTTGSSTGAHLHYEIRSCPYSQFYDVGTLGGFSGMPKHAIDPKPFLDAVAKLGAESKDHAALVTAKASLTPEEAAYLNAYAFNKALWSKLWEAMKKYPKRNGGSYGKDYATAVIRATGFEWATVSYIWAMPNASEVWRKLWWQMT
jgi:hypothetical protein